MEAVGHLTAGIAHNFNNHLQGVSILIELVLEDIEDAATSPLKEAQTVLGKAAEMVSQLMVISRKQLRREKKKVFKFVELVENEVNICRRTFDRKIEIEFTNDVGVFLVEGEESGLHQAVLNILINARDAVSEKKGESPSIEITIEQTVQDIDGIDDSLEAEAVAYVCVKFMDNGIGMDEYTKAHMFDPFFTTKEVGKGTGLGLSTSYAIVHDNGGWIACEPRQKCGVTVAVYLPLVDQEVLPSLGNETETVESSGKGSILIVEDDRIIGRNFQVALRKQGYTVHWAKDGVVGLELFEQNPKEIQLAIVDLSMPRMRGDELIGHLLAIDPELKIVVMTGELEVSPNLGKVNRVLRKPIRLREFIKTIQTVWLQGDLK
jgi:CheY-like chemotaxis protein